VLHCRQRRRWCTERRGGHREQVVWRRYGIDSNCYHYASYCFKYFCSFLSCHSGQSSSVRIFALHSPYSASSNNCTYQLVQKYSR
jgi:hypothetical protein